MIYFALFIKVHPEYCEFNWIFYFAAFTSADIHIFSEIKYFLQSSLVILLIHSCIDQETVKLVISYSAENSFDPALYLTLSGSFYWLSESIVPIHLSCELITLPVRFEFIFCSFCCFTYLSHFIYLGQHTV